MERGLNEVIAAKLREMADLLEQQQGNPFRVSAYRRAADTLARETRSAAQIVESEGVTGLTALPGVGQGIARAIYEMVATGRWSQLERLRGSLEPERLFRTIPGIGPELARRIYEELHVDSLEALEQAAHDGRLEAVPGMGPRRGAVVRAALASILGRRVRARAAGPSGAPEVATLLEVDREYRERVEAGTLPTIAPRRFNPEGKPWLPVLHTVRGDWHFTVMFSNTARAHELGRTHDWVVIYFYDEQHQEGQQTVVTESRGSLSGMRVVRGREAECRSYYAEHGS